MRDPVTMVSLNIAMLGHLRLHFQISPEHAVEWCLLEQFSDNMNVDHTTVMPLLRLSSLVSPFILTQLFFLNQIPSFIKKNPKAKLPEIGS